MGIARYDYTEGGTEELSFQIGDKIILQAKDESGWWLGKLDKTGVVGWFAPDLVVPLNEKLENEKENESDSKFKFDEQNGSKNEDKTQTQTQESTTNGAVKKKTAPPKSEKKTKKTSISRKDTKPKKPSAPKKKAQPPKKSKSKSKIKKEDEKIEIVSVDEPEPADIISYEDLKKKNFGNIDVNKKKLEDYLCNKEFIQIFKMSRTEFAKKPAWKQRNMKKDSG